MTAMATPDSDLPAAGQTPEELPTSIDLCVLDANINSETGIFNHEQAGFWFPERQEGEADAEIAAGSTRRFSSIEDYETYLDTLDDDEE